MLKTYPTPVNVNEIIYFNQQVCATLYDLQGRKIITQKNTTTLNLPRIASGVYVLKTNKGDTQQIFIK
ncbi:T9SS type A sorting domain-containing protein [Lacinutrix undariae]